MSTFDDWLDARDAETLERAWNALGARTIELAPRDAGASTDPLGCCVTGHGAALLASTFLDVPIDRVEWLAKSELELDREAPPQPVFATSRTVGFSFLEHCVDVREACYEYWDVRELVVATRGVQRVNVRWGIDDGTRDGGHGGRGTVVRVFDRATRIGASVPLYDHTAYVIGELDVRGLFDLFSRDVGIRVASWTTYDIAGARALCAQLAVEIDAHFDQSATWPAAVDRHGADGDVLWWRQRFEHGPHAIVMEHLDHQRDTTLGRMQTSLELHGLPWGQQLTLSLFARPEGVFGVVNMRAPLASAERVVARLDSLGKLG